MKDSVIIGRWQIHWMMLALITLCFASCKDDNEEHVGSFDPDKPIVVSDFIPKVGGLATRMVLYGENFGNDISRIKVIIGSYNIKLTISNK
ncbi:MAG: IPT/TIG domain-containing protein [Eubacteriales bacterium]|nr:IPT/TIG domain-containing protein [Eubacteriales bacterium]